MFLFDRLVSMLPWCLFLLHLTKAADSGIHQSISARMAFSAATSELLKRIFRRKRRERSFAFRPWNFGSFSGLAGAAKGNYSFPSTHAVFFSTYFIAMPCTFTLVLLLLGSFYRVYYEHHVVSEVASGVILALVAELCLRALGRAEMHG
jgi:membrane-associated phospholipid phosphatase